MAIVEQVFRNEQSFVVKDPSTHAYFRFRPIEIRVMRLFDGARSAAEIAEQLVADGLRISASTVDGFARKLSKLGLLERTLLERTTQQLERLRSERNRQRSLIRGELFRMRFSFGDPDRWLSRTYPLVRWCFTPAFVVLSVAMFVTYLMIMGFARDTYVHDLAATFSFGALSLWSLVVIVGAFTLLTAIHEFGHAFACKHFGGEVHEMGFMLLFFMPAFYANVNDAWSFPERRARLWVTAAGAWIELFVTSLLAVVWLIVQPGSVISQIALAAMLIGGVANVLTNVNPLLPLDGYFALGDWLEMTNLRQRAKSFAGAWIRRHILREDEVVPELDVRERRILLWYGVASSAYVTGVLVMIGLSVIGSAYRSLGGLVAAALVGLLLYAVRGLLGAVVHAVRSATTRTMNGAVLALRSGSARGRRWRIGVAIVAVLLLIAAVTPVGLTAHGEFVVEATNNQLVTAPATGVVASVFVREGDVVSAGAPLLRVVNFEQEQAQVRRMRDADSLTVSAVVTEARAQLGASRVLSEQAASVSASVRESRAQQEALRVRASIAGVVSTSHPERLVGRAVQFGDTLVRVVDLRVQEAVIRVRGAGASGVHVGDKVRLLSHQDGTPTLTGVVASVSPIAEHGAGGARYDTQGAVEARMDLDPATALREGTRGEARVTWRRSTLLGALLWTLRSRLRADLLL